MSQNTADPSPLSVASRDDPQPRILTYAEQAEMIAAAWHWERAYEITWDGRAFRAHYTGSKPASDLTDPDIFRLRERLRNDYGFRGGRGSGD